MPKFKIINDDGSVSEYKPTPKIPVKQVDTTNHTTPKVYPKNPVPKPIKVYPKTGTPSDKPEQITGNEKSGFKSLDTPSAVTTSGTNPAGEPVHPLPTPSQTSPAPLDKVIVTEFTPATPAVTTPASEAAEIKVTTPSSDTMIFSPIVKGKHAKQAQAVSSDDKVYAIDQKGMDSLINAIADTLSDKFVSKDEVSSVVSSVIQGMVVPNSVK